MTNRLRRPHDLVRACVLPLLLLPALALGAKAETETGPTRLGLIGLSETIVVPGIGGAPVRFGLHASTGTWDPEYGIALDLDVPEVTSRELRAVLQFRASNRLVLGGALPFRTGAIERGPSVSGLGDIDVGAQARLFETGPVRWGAWARVSLPTGDRLKGLSTDEIESEAGLTTTLRLFRDGLAPELRWHVNLGYRQNQNENEGFADYYTSNADASDPRTDGFFFPSYPATAGLDARDNDAILLRTALEFRRRWGHIFLEYSAEWWRNYDAITWQENTTWITPGLHLGGESGPQLTAAWSIGLFVDDENTDYEPRLPDSRFEIGVSMPLYLGGRDRDDDLVPDDQDACPDRPEDIDGYEDDDGCPDDDNDGDGVPDAIDLAPNLPEDLDGFADGDGRPELDNDFDGIPDTVDRCPLRAEDFDGVDDEDGCPDIVLDRDGDGIVDAEDACPDRAEDGDGFEDGDGCPELDNDLDGVPDDQDGCPDDPEDYDGDEDDDGCPDDVSSSPDG